MPLSSPPLLDSSTTATETRGSNIKTTKFWFVTIVDKCDVMICLHSAHTPGPCDRFTP